MPDSTTLDWNKLFQAAEIGVWSYAPESDLVRWGPGLATVLRAPGPELALTDFVALLTPLPEAANLLRAALLSQQDYSDEFYQSGDETSRWLALRAGGGGGVVFDLTQRRRDALRRREERYQALAAASGQLVWTTDPAGVCQEESPSWCAYTGGSILGPGGWLPWIHPDDRPDAERVGPEAAREEEYRIRSREGVYHTFLVWSVPVYEADGQLRERIWSGLDVTERKAAQAALRQTLADTETFVYGVSHDLRAPLVNLQGFCRELSLSWNELGQLLEPVEMEPQTRASLKSVLESDIPGAMHFLQESANRLERLVAGLLALSRCGRVEYRWELVDLGAVARGAVDQYRHVLTGRDVAITVGDLPAVRGDANALGQLFANLLGNAVNYLEPTRPGRIEVAATPEGDMVHCRVQDNGSGIPAEAVERVFDAFTRFHPHLAAGEGLGLAVVKKVVARHRGRISVESEPGRGTTFHIWLPFAGGEA